MKKILGWLLIIPFACLCVWATSFLIYIIVGLLWMIAPCLVIVPIAVISIAGIAVFGMTLLVNQ